ncbi:MAG: (d)CMP kinase, partial [bacterium]
MPKQYYVIAIDGPAGSGKTSTAKLLAKKLGILHIDTGAMYRAITLKALDLKIPVTEKKKVTAMAEVTNIIFKNTRGNTSIFMDGKNISSAIRSQKVTDMVSEYCCIPGVRKLMVDIQRNYSKKSSIVMEGRDIGTIVFPNARYKFYMDASIKVRAIRRRKEMLAQGLAKPLKEIEQDIMARDRKDKGRKNSPLKKGRGAQLIDTTGLTIKGQVEK